MRIYIFVKYVTIKNAECILLYYYLSTAKAKLTIIVQLKNDGISFKFIFKTRPSLKTTYIIFFS